MIEGTFSDLVNPVIISEVNPNGQYAYFEIWRDVVDQDNWGCVENNIGVWKHSDDYNGIGNAISAYIEDNFDLSGNTSFHFSGGNDHENPPTTWETL